MYDMLEMKDPVLSTLLAQLPVGVVIASRNGDLDFVNDAARALFAEHRQTKPEATDALEPIHWVIARILLTGELIRDEEIEFLDKRDEWRTLRVSGTALEDTLGDITGALVTLVDVTAVNRAKEWEPLIRAISKL
jgi:PAS domain-containing protein